MSSAGDEGLFFPITILDNPPYDAPYVSQENFGPLRSIIKYRTVEEAIQKANDTPYGLGASVWGRDPATLAGVDRAALGFWNDRLRPSLLPGPQKHRKAASSRSVPGKPIRRL